MGSDQALTLGIILAILSVPACLSALSDDRWPRGAAVMALVAGLSVAYAMVSTPEAYHMADVPEIVIAVLASLVK